MTLTIQLEDSLVQDLERLAARQQQPLSSLLESALWELLQKDDLGDKELPVFRGGRGLQPGVDLDRSSALLDWLERVATLGCCSA